MGKKELSPEMQECLKVLEKFVANSESEPFRLPVEWKAWGLLDYPQIVKEPMDLESVRANLLANKYDDLTTYVRDMKLIWHNCMTYNADNSSYYKVALKLDKLFDKEVTKLAKKFGASAKGLLKDSSSTLLNMKPVSADEKARFCRNVYEIRAISLGKVVQMIDDNCPSALNKSNPEEVEIIVDLVDNTTFRALDVFVKECVAKEKLRKKNKKKDKAAAAVAAATATDANKSSASSSSGSPVKKDTPTMMVVQPHSAKTPAEKKKEEDAKKEAAEKKANNLKRPREEAPPAAAATSPAAPVAGVGPSSATPLPKTSETTPGDATTASAAIVAAEETATASAAIVAAEETATAMETDTPADAVVADNAVVKSSTAEQESGEPASKRVKVDGEAPSTDATPAVAVAVAAAAAPASS